MAKDKPKKKIIRKLKNKFRLVIMNDQTLEEKMSMVLTPLSFFIVTGLIAITLITCTIYIIAFTPLREYIPGYADVHMKRNMINLTLKADTLDTKTSATDLYLENIKRIINGEVVDSVAQKLETEPVRFDTMRTPARSAADSLLRNMIETQDKYDLTASPGKGSTSGIANFFFFTPLKGTVTSRFDPAEKHFGIDIVAKANEVIKSTLDGTVITSTWTYENGYVIALQHSNNLMSVYKHNSALLKREGAYVKAGEVIAIIGNSGENSTGPHLHFELWHNGSALNPLDYMNF